MATNHLSVVLKKLGALAARRHASLVPDAELVDRFVRQHDEAAFEILMARHGPMVLSLCHRLLPDPHAAADVFQATFLVMARKAGSLRKRDSVGDWLYGIAYRTAARARVEAAKRRNRESQALGRPTTDGLADISAREFLSVLDEELHALSAEHRAPLILCYLQDKSCDEAATQLGLTLSTFRRRLERGRRFLRSRLARRGIAPSISLLPLLLGQSGASACVPATLAAATANAAKVFAAGKPAAGIVSSTVIALTTEVLNGMTIAKLTSALTVLFVTAVVGIGIGASVLPHAMLAAESAKEPLALHEVVQIEEIKPEKNEPPKMEPPKIEPPKAEKPEIPTKDANLPEEPQALQNFSHIHIDFRGGKIDEQLLDYSGNREYLTVEPEGLRISVPREAAKPPPNGVFLKHHIQGDCDITVSFELLKAERPSAGNVGVILYIRTNAPTHDAAMLCRYNRKNGNVYACNKMWTNAEGKRQSAGHVPRTRDLSGQLRLSRRGSLVFFQVAEIGSQEFVTLHQCNLGTEDLEYIRIAADNTGADQPVEVRIHELDIRSSDAVLENPIPSSSAARPRRRLWQWLAGSILLLTLLAVGLLLMQRKWLHRRASNRSEKAAGSALADPRQTPAQPIAATVSFGCNGCGQRLTAKRELVGKKTKCPHCGQVLLIPKAGD